MSWSTNGLRTCWWPSKSFWDLFSIKIIPLFKLKLRISEVLNEWNFAIKKNLCTYQRNYRPMLVLFGNPILVRLDPSNSYPPITDSQPEVGPELGIKSSYCYCPHPSEFWRSIFVFNHPGWMVGGGLNHEGRQFNFHFPLIQTPTMAPSK